MNFLGKWVQKQIKPTVYEVLYKREFRSADDKTVLCNLEQKHTLTFPPHPGLEIVASHFPMDDSLDDITEHDFASYYTGKIISVMYRYNVFECICEPYKIEKHPITGTMPNLDEALFWLYDGEWELAAIDCVGGHPCLDALVQFVEKEAASIRANPAANNVLREKRLHRIQTKLGDI